MGLNHDIFNHVSREHNTSFQVSHLYCSLPLYVCIRTAQSKQSSRLIIHTMQTVMHVERKHEL